MSELIETYIDSVCYVISGHKLRNRNIDEALQRLQDLLRNSCIKPVLVEEGLQFLKAAEDAKRERTKLAS